jgi:hypothetical protein
MAKLNLAGVSQIKRRLVYKIFQIYRDCGYLKIYKQIFPLDHLLSYSEYDLKHHLDRLESGESILLRAFPKFRKPGYEPPDPRMDLARRVTKKIVRQLTFWAMVIFLGCATDPITARMAYENHIFERHSTEEALRILAPDYTICGVVAFPYSTGPGAPSTPYFYDTFYYKNSAYLQSTYGHRVR